MTRDELAEASGYSASSGGYRNALGALRTLELINHGPDVRVDDSLASELGRG
jgi:hypothetical protein